MKKLIEIVVKACAAWCLKRNRVFYITGGPTGKTVYLVRYILFKSKYACIYIHRFMRSDSDDPHDHPWNFFTYVISGGYMERLWDRKTPTIQDDNFKELWRKKVNHREPGSIAYRKATDIHQVVLDRSYEMEEIEQAPFTICLMGPRIREWGFWNLKGTTWTDWRSYLSIKPGDHRIEGSE